MTRSARLPALAKLNLDLRVLHRRPDGFHELRTIFQTISLADRIEAHVTPGRSRHVDLDADVDIPDNLILRAAHRVLEATGAAAHVRFRLRKRIPMGGGLGGGSSDAAAVLLGLPVLLGRPIPAPALHDIAASLGSDVPFFLLGGTAVGLGRGTELYPLPDLRPRPGLLVAPGLHVSTPEAYRALGRDLTYEPYSSILNTFQLLAGSLEQVLDAEAVPGVENDFEPVVFRQHPRLRLLQRQLWQCGARPARMTGSGSALFGLFRSREETRMAASQFQRETVFPITLVTRSRYRALWRRSLRAHLAMDSGGAQAWPPLSRYGQ